MSSAHWNSQYQSSSSNGPAQLRKSRPGSKGHSRMASSDNTAPQRHGRSHSFFSFSSKKSAQEQAQQAMETVLESQPPQGQGQHRPSDAPTPVKRPSLDDAPSMATNPTIQREIKSVVDLALAHAHKVYFSGPLIRRIERVADGNKPARDDGWVDVWAQLGGTTLSVWDMKAIEEANKRGEEVPPSYINITDCFVQVLGALTSPATPTAPAKRYTNVITINTAGSNLIFFACPSSAALVSWASSIRLAAWEKSRLEEIYTGHLLRMSLSDGGPWKEPAGTLVKGRLEGEVKVRIAGQTDWKPLWMVLSMQAEPAAVNNGNRPVSPVASTTSIRSKNRMSSLFSRQNSTSAPAPVGPVVPVIMFYQSQKMKDRRKPVLSIRYISQAFAVYPERPEVIQKSTLIKLEGLLGHEELGGQMRGKESWLMIMPETQQAFPVLELIKWLIAIHDLFGLYGRPQQYVWDPLQPLSMWFAYPVGPQRGQLFIDREMAERLDPRDDRTSAIRRELRQILITKLYGSSTPPGGAVPQQLGVQQQIAQPQQQQQNAPVSPPVSQPSMSRESSNNAMQLPPLDFGGDPRQQPGQRQVTSPGGQRPAMQQQQQPQYSPMARSPGEYQLHGAQGQEILPAPASQALYQQSPPPLRSEASYNLPSVQEERSMSPTQSSSGGRPGFPSRQSSGNLAETIGQRPTVDSAERAYVSSPLAGASRPKSPLSQASQGSVTSRPDPKLTSNSYAMGRQTNNGPQPASPVQSSSSMYTPSNSMPMTTSPTNQTTPTSLQMGMQAPMYAQNNRALSSTSQSPPPIRTATASPMSRSMSPERNQAPSPVGKSDTQRGTSAQQPSEIDLPPPRLVPRQKGLSEVSDLANEASVLFLLQQQQEQQEQQQAATRQDPPSQGNQDGWNTDSDSDGPETKPPPRHASPPVRQGPTAYRSVADQSEAANVSSRVVGVGRRPSGARAKPGPSRHGEQGSSGDNLSSSIQSIQTPPPSNLPVMEERSELPYDDTADALAALSFLERQEEPPPQPVASKQLVSSSQGSMDESPTPSTEGQQYKSTFAPSRQAAERKAKALAQQEANYAATHKPGKPKGGAKGKRKDRGAWAESSEEEEDEDEEDEDDGSDDDERRQQPQVKQPQPVHANDPRASVYPSAQPGAHSSGSLAYDAYGQGQRSRMLPQPPGRGDPYENHPRGSSADDRHRAHPDEPRSQTLNPHIAARQSVWSTVLDHQQPPKNASAKDTFVQVDDNDTMTKAFQPQGLLSAGLQDKEDRSAKRQEELARETGASLINVPNKPPPPQTGLLGAITAHERERKREGGVGAALTERERERRLAEERQRKLDEMQRQQLDQMSQGGIQGGFDAYGQQQGFPGYMPGFDPRMTMNPMMLNPYMAGGFPMMPFGNPQQMMAAQMAAQQAYQQAMMSFSQAGGSQFGEQSPQHTGTPPTIGGTPSPAGSPSPMQGGMMGMDPRMSMGMNPWMGMGMGQMGGMSPGMSPIGQMGQMGPMNPTAMNPMGMMDPRISVAQQSPYSGPVQGQGRVPSLGASPSPRDGSPAPQRSSNNNSPRPQG